MKISGHSLGSLLQLLAPLFGIVTAVWILRFMVAAIPGVPSWLVSVLSVSIFVPICIILATVLIFARRFGGYTSVVVSSFLLVTWSQFLVVAAILFALWTGIDNIYTAPEFSMMNDPSHRRHILGHLTFGIGLETLIGSFMGCLILYMLRQTRRRERDEQG